MGGELEWEPEKVEFAVDFQDSAQVTVKNPTGKRMAFKIKCSDNDLFKIRPVMGILDDAQTSSVTLTFTPKDKGQAPADPHHFSLYQLEVKDADPNARKLWDDPAAKKLPRVKRAAVVFTKADKKADKKDDKKEEKEDKKEDDKADDKKEDEEGREEKLAAVKQPVRQAANKHNRKRRQRPPSPGPKRSRRPRRFIISSTADGADGSAAAAEPEQEREFVTISRPATAVITSIEAQASHATAVKDKRNKVRRERYAADKDEINKRRRLAYAAKKKKAEASSAST